jgi:hypothetical protein
MEMTGARKTVFLFLLCAACPKDGPPPDAPPPPPSDEAEPDVEGGESETLETGKNCATAEALCDGGVCTAKIKNSCPQPVTCELEMYALCQRSDDQDEGEARGKGRGTIPAGESGEIQAGANCEGRAVKLTQQDGLSCK